MAQLWVSAWAGLSNFGIKTMSLLFSVLLPSARAVRVLLVRRRTFVDGLEAEARVKVTSRPLIERHEDNSQH